jgi:zinc finger protein CreA/MIG
MVAVTQERQFKCHLCDNAFKRLEHQARHIRTHTREKPHVCQFPGCAMKFSRSDQLTRHSRIHMKAKPRKTKNKHRTVQQGSQNGGLQEALFVIPPPNKNMSQSAPVSAIGSPMVFPHSYTSYSTIVPSNRLHSWNKFFSLSTYAVSRSHSHDEDDQYPNRNDPNSTSPSSQTFSYDSLSLIPEHATLATSIQPLRLRPCGGGYDLPGISNLSLQQTPAITPIEPQHVDGQCHTNNQPTSTPRSRSVISDIISRTDGTERKLPDLPAREVVMVAGQQLVDNFMASVEFQGKHSTTGSCKAL